MKKNHITKEENIKLTEEAAKFEEQDVYEQEKKCNAENRIIPKDLINDLFKVKVRKKQFSKCIKKARIL